MLFGLKWYLFCVGHNHEHRNVVGIVVVVGTITKGREMSDRKYNGWSNYETWLVNLWLDSEEHSQELLRSFAENAVEDAQIDGSEKSHAVYGCSKMIQNEVEENTPEVEGMFADLLNAAMSEVNWYEIAEHIVDDMLQELDIVLPE